MTEPMVDALLPLPPRVFAILLLLAEGPRHGYAVLQALRAAGPDRLPPGPATVYRTLKEMEAAGLISAEAEPAGASGGPPRRTWRLSGFGRRVTAAEAGRMRKLAMRAGELLADT